MTGTRRRTTVHAPAALVMSSEFSPNRNGAARLIHEKISLPKPRGAARLIPGYSITATMSTVNDLFCLFAVVHGPDQINPSLGLGFGHNEIAVK